MYPRGTMPGPLPFLAPILSYREQAAMLLAAHRAGDPAMLEFIRGHHPRFLDAKITWLPRDLTPEEIAAAPFDEEDARLAVARGYSFRDWPALEEHVLAVGKADSPVRRFETAVEAVIGGDLAGLRALLRDDPALVVARSARRTCHDPSAHRATLLHYLAANGVEGYRQRTPPEAVEVARTLLDAGAEVDALAGMYGGEHATLPLLVSSDPPARAGVQRPLAELLLDRGAAVDGVGNGAWSAPLRTALVFGFRDTAELLASRGATIDLVAAAGLGRDADVRRLLPGASAADRHRALAIAAILGEVEPLRVLLDAGEDPGRFNPDGFHAHATPLHQAALAGHRAAVELLLARGARTDVEDAIHRSTPLGWAEYGGQAAIADLLRSH